MKSLVILSCSQRKAEADGLLPAIDRYDGNQFRVYRKARRENRCPDSVTVCIVSAEFGLLTGADCIPNYDRRMTPDRAESLQQDVTRKLNDVVAAAGPSSVFIDLGADYLPAVSSLDSILEGCKVTKAVGRRGQRQRQFREWLSAQ